MAYVPSVKVVQESLSNLDWMPGFPSGEGRLELFSEAVASFVDDRLRIFDEASGKWRILTDPPDGEKPPQGAVRPFSWLLREVARTCVFCPKPIEMRKIYEKRFQPLDHRSSRELEEALEA